jgi:hypothetical protein
MGNCLFKLTLFPLFVLYIYIVMFYVRLLFPSYPSNVIRLINPKFNGNFKNYITFLRIVVLHIVLLYVYIYNF